MIKNLLSIFTLALLMSIAGDVNAKHIVGGEITYTCIGTDTSGTNVFTIFRFELFMYRDCYQQGQMLTPFDDPALVGVHVEQNGNWNFVESLNVELSSSREIDPNQGECVTIPENLCVDQGAYTFTLRLLQRPESYMVSYQRCCRNNTISNIRDPGGTGALYSIEISPDAQQLCNNSARFNDFPPLVICDGFDFEFDHSATDDDGDQLVYEFCTPLAAGGPDTYNSSSCVGTVPDPQMCRPPYDNVLFNTPTYSAAEPITGDPALRINGVTGRITGVPNLQGQFVVGVCVKEFRDGALLSTVRRDFQFNVTNCTPVVLARIQADEVIDGEDFVINSCGLNSVTIENLSTREEFIDRNIWQFFDNDGTELFRRETPNERESVTVEFPGFGEYQGTLMLNPGSDCADTADIIVNIFPSLEADFVFEYDTCVAGPVAYTDMSFTNSEFLREWDWNFNDGERSTLQNPNYQFRRPGFNEVKLTVTDDNFCTAEITKIVDWRPVPQLIVVEPSSFLGCQPAEIFFNNLSTPIDETYDIFWDFGDQGSSTEISPTHVYEEAGVFDVQVDIVSPIGCQTERSFSSLIRIEEKPTAAFGFTPEKPNAFNRTVSFIDQSINAISWQWNFNDEASAFDPNPTYTFRDTGVHEIQLVVVHPTGCTDTTIQTIDIEPIVDFYMPNAFTPNSDAKNDTFRGKGYLAGMQGFSMSIWDRWGEKVFETVDPSEGWNGRKDNVGGLLPQGVYVYLVNYAGPRGKEKELKGFATLIR